MKKITVLLFFLMFLAGCIQSKEHLTIRQDGTGTVKTDLFVPSGTVELIDTTLGGMMNAMAGAFGAEEQPPKSIAEEMFANKDEIIKKAEQGGLNIKFISFKSTKDEKGLHVNYEIAFDDFKKLMNSKVLNSRFIIREDKKGNWICEPKASPEEAKASDEQAGQLRSFKDSPQFNEMDSVQQKLILDAMQNFKIETLVTLPSFVREVSGIFEKVDDHTVKVEFSGSLLGDDELIDKLYGMGEEGSRAIWAPDTMLSSSKENSQAISAQASSSQEKTTTTKGTKIHLLNGKTVKGTILESNGQYIKIEAFGVPLTYYRDEIKSVE